MNPTKSEETEYEKKIADTKRTLLMKSGAMAAILTVFILTECQIIEIAALMLTLPCDVSCAASGHLNHEWVKRNGLNMVESNNNHHDHDRSDQRA